MGWGMARPEYYDRTPSSQYTNTTIVGDDISPARHRSWLGRQDKLGTAR